MDVETNTGQIFIQQTVYIRATTHTPPTLSIDVPIPHSNLYLNEILIFLKLTKLGPYH